MGLINYTDIDFKKSINKELNTFDFNGSEVTIVPYLSIGDKYDLIMTAINKAYSNGIYDPIKIHMCMDLGFVYKYTNIIFTNEELQDEVALYDNMQKSGLIQKVKENIAENEIVTIYSYLTETVEKIEKNQSNVFSVINNLITALPTFYEKAKDLLKDFPIEALQNLIKINMKEETEVETTE